MPVGVPAPGDGTATDATICTACPTALGSGDDESTVAVWAGSTDSLTNGEVLPWKSGSPDVSERLLVTFQTYRYRGEVTITPGEHGGYLIYVTVFKELEDLPKPVRATAGGAAFRSDNTVERQFEVVDPTVVEGGWVPKGREVHLEQAILQKLQKRLEPGKGEKAGE